MARTVPRFGRGLALGRLQGPPAGKNSLMSLVHLLLLKGHPSSHLTRPPARLWRTPCAPTCLC
ncbi:hypothetical protein I79_026188 [Cricetulus griseus]|uniref:Uncharacterized protein n=1 Tax=Cricetulus griseus TaxID=10029 RepID=G3IQ87_CRIGR|nr:hypothetical protein I79_026188 [Cricetulus griseus]